MKDNKIMSGFLTKIKTNKSLMYLLCISILLLLCISLNITFAVFSNGFKGGDANISINNLKYRMIINEVELDESVGTSIPSNTIIGDRIILLKAGKTEQFNTTILSLNNMDTKYEIIYKVCSDVNCTSFIDTPSDIQIAYHIDTPYVSGELKANKSKSIYLVTDNQTSNDYYIQVGLNVGYSHNTLALTNQITNDFATASLDGTLSIIGYVNGVEVETFPTEPNYETGITCLYKDGTVSSARGVFSYNVSKGWEVDVFGLNRSLTTCRVDFTEILKVTYEVLSTRYDCANLASSAKPSNPVISYTGNCSVVQDTANSDGTHTWKMRLLTSGTLTVNGMIYIDVFLVGGGGGASSGGAGGSGGGSGNYGKACSTGAKYGSGKGQGTTTCEFGEGTLSGCTRGDDFAYSTAGCDAPTKVNSGNGGLGESTSGSNGYAGYSGIVVIRDVRS